VTPSFKFSRDKHHLPFVRDPKTNVSFTTKKNQRVIVFDSASESTIDKVIDWLHQHDLGVSYSFDSCTPHRYTFGPLPASLESEALVAFRAFDDADPWTDNDNDRFCFRTPDWAFFFGIYVLHITNELPTYFPSSSSSSSSLSSSSFPATPSFKYGRLPERFECLSGYLRNFVTALINYNEVDGLGILFEKLQLAFVHNTNFHTWALPILKNLLDTSRLPFAVASDRMDRMIEDFLSHCQVPVAAPTTTTTAAATVSYPPSPPLLSLPPPSSSSSSSSASSL